ncbi:MAG TPA: NAD(P)H-binding protein [Bryobacteraceae bacterium]|nr:NAD(P)H-binding protein [Bryobacteraceae bacterium]
MQNRVLVTAATGILGKAIVEAAVGAELPVRQAVRNPAKANPNVEAVRLDYADAATIAPALAGVSAMVLMAPPLDPNAPAEVAPVIAAAKAANLEHLIFISAFGVNHSEQAPLRIVEHLVMDSGVPFTILRPNFFMENFSEGFLARGIREQNAIYLAAGNGETSFISARDIAAVVVTVLQKRITGRDFDLTGPAALDHTEVAKIISEVSGRTVTYHPLTEQQMLEGARAQGMPEPTVAYMGMLYAVVRAGFEAPVSGDVETITGRKPMTFEAFWRTL